MTLRTAERLAEWGWDVEWFTASYAGCSAEETIGNVRFIRCGNQLTVHLHAAQRYRADRRFDVVVDEINTIPFYAHCYIRAPTVAYINQIAGEVWRLEAPSLIGYAGMLSEPLYLRPYRDVPIVTISPSSMESLRVIGMRGSISVIPMSVDEQPDVTVPAKVVPRDVVVLGRVTPSKRIEHAIDAAATMRMAGWNGRLLIVGAGDPAYVAKLRRRAHAPLGDRARFYGRVSNAERTRILREASCLWMTSVREGWGLAVTEAARHGTPAVVYGVAGLVDSVVDGETGYVVAENPAAVAEATARLFGDQYDRFARTSLEASRKLNWDDTARQFQDALLQRLSGSRSSVEANAFAAL